MSRLLRVRESGRISYRDAWRLQQEAARARLAGEIPDTVFLVEHPHVITLGVKGRAEDILLTAEERAASGVEIIATDRGGEVTYHGPGQIVIYPIFDLRQHGQDIHAYLRGLESALIDCLARFGVTGERDPRHTGVWVSTPRGPEKIAALGIKVSRWITQHGAALNVTTDLTWFRRIIPCGIRDRGVTSLAALGAPAPPDAICRELPDCLKTAFGFTEILS